MDATLEKKLINCWRPSAAGCVSREETAETVVPDTLPDIAEIVDADGVILIRGKECTKGAVNITAEIVATVLFLPEGGGNLCRITMKMPWNCSMEADSADENAVAVAALRLRSMDARALNPRKVLLRAEACAEICCYRRETLELPCAVQSRPPVETLTESCVISPVTAVREKTFAVVDEFTLPGARPAIGSILGYRVDLAVEEVKSVGTKLVFKGCAATEILYAAVDTEAPVSASFRTDFSQIIEMEALCDQGSSEITLLLTGAYIEQLSPNQQCRAIKAELHLAAQAVLRQQLQAEYISDAYCCRASACVEKASVAEERLERYMELRETVRELMETPQPVQDVIAVRSHVSHWEVRENGVECSLSVRALYRAETGAVSCVGRNYAVCFRSEQGADLQMKVLGVYCPETFASPGSGGVEIRVPVDMRLALMGRCEMQPIISVKLEEDPEREERPSLLIRRAGKRDSLWSLAKAGGSTVELIRQVNALEDDRLPEECVLLIPKVR